MSTEIETQLAVELSVVLGPESGLFTPTDTGLKLSDDISFDQWREVLKFLKMSKSKATLWLSDVIAFGKAKWGLDAVEKELGQLEFDMPTVRAAIAIDTVPRELRYPNLNSEHYIELSKAPDKKRQIKWARIASEEGLTPSQLKFSIIENEVVGSSASRQLKSGLVTIQGIRQSFDVWLRRVGGFEGVSKMESDHQEEILTELEEIIDFALQLRAEFTGAESTNAA